MLDEREIEENYDLNKEPYIGSDSRELLSDDKPIPNRAKGSLILPTSTCYLKG